MGLFVILGLIFFISPLFGVVLSFFGLYFYHNKKDKSLICFFYLGLFLGLINCLKVPENDLENYILMYSTGHELGFIPYVFSFGKEQMFMVFNYSVYALTGGSVELYLIIFTVICYMLIFYSIWIVHNKIKQSTYTFVMAISVAFFFPNLFLLSAHLMRQFMAASLVLFLIVNFIFNGKKGYVYYILSVLIHSSSLLFGFLFFPFLKRRVSNKKIFTLAGILGVVLLLSFKFSGFFLKLFANVPVLSYVFYRLNGTEVVWETDNLGLSNFILQMFVVFVFYKVANMAKLYQFKSLQTLYISSLLLLLFVVANYSNTELALRFSFYLYFLFPIAFYFLPFLLSKEKALGIEKLLALFLCILFGLWFVYKLNYGVWTFNNLETLLLNYEL